MQYIMEESFGVDNRLGYCVFIVTLVSLHCINILVERRGKPKSARANLDSWRWRNLVISWIHGLVCGCWSILSIYNHPEFVYDPVTFNSPMVFYMVVFSTGYFLYDTIDMVLNKKLIAYWEVTLHHIFVVPGFWYNWHTNICIGYSLTALTAEINSFFLHSRKLLQIQNVGFDTILYRTCSYVNLVSFFLCRIIPIGFIVFHLFGSHGIIHRQQLSVVYVNCFRVIMVIVAVVNVVLFWRLLKTDLIRPFLKSKRKEQFKINGNNNQTKEE
ncbi:TLC domain-containing protein 2-like [Mytilus californianus]|uniref:TLC domain-containing protein 2-like n=1 Tax=Mytilus californianus TaxID=6549 RepID=UPI0022459F62|nr:TLC domain-containing protein 2-like [Mytilus californianus]